LSFYAAAISPRLLIIAADAAAYATPRAYA